MRKTAREGNWAQSTFAKTSGNVTRDSEKNSPIADQQDFSVTIPETLAGRISVQVPF